MPTDLDQRYQTDLVFHHAVDEAVRGLELGLTPHDLHVAASMACDLRGRRHVRVEPLPAQGDLPEGWAIARTETLDEVAAITCGALRSSIIRSGVIVTEHRSHLPGCHDIVGTRAVAARWLLWAHEVAGPTGTWQPKSPPGGA
jgi:hypothetical protein